MSTYPKGAISRRHPMRQPPSIGRNDRIIKRISEKLGGRPPTTPNLLARFCEWVNKKTDIDLSGLKLSYFPPGVLLAFSHATKINLSHNPLTFLPVAELQALNNLREVIFDHASLEQVPELLNIHVLSANHCNIAVYPEWVKQPDCQLRVLQLEGNRLLKRRYQPT